jgi:transposase-like protein
MSNLSTLHLHDEEAAYAFLEAVLWPDGPICPHCGGVEHIVRIPANPAKRVRHGLYRCHSCKKQLTVKVGTVFEDSKVPLHKWLQAVTLMVTSNKGVSSHQLHRLLDVTYKTAWFMSHRIREGLRDGSLSPLGSAGAAVEADETYFGEKADPRKRRKPGQRGPVGKRPVVGLVERGGKVRTFHVEKADKATVAELVRENIVHEAELMTDESSLYTDVGAEFASHETVCHSAGEYVRGDAHTNTMDGYWGLFKRGMRGVYQHCAEKHLHRYLAEFDFRYDRRAELGVSDGARAAKTLEGIRGKRLTYRDSSSGDVERMGATT